MIVWLPRPRFKEFRICAAAKSCAIPKLLVLSVTLQQFSNNSDFVTMRFVWHQSRVWRTVAATICGGGCQDEHARRFWISPCFFLAKKFRLIIHTFLTP